MQPDALGWDDFLARLSWRQGEHVALIGPTGQGKTTLALELLPRRSHTVVVATKPRDATLARLVRTDGYHRQKRWPPANDTVRRVLLWPDWRTPDDTRRQAEAIRAAVWDIFRSGSWCIFADDVQYLTDQLGLRNTLTSLWLQARALNVSVVAATQRPRHVPLEMFSQSTHLFLWGTNDEDDLRRIGGLGGLSNRAVRRMVQNLPRHDVLYINTRTGDLATTRVGAPCPSTSTPLR